MRARDLLHKSKLTEFTNWLIEKGWKIETPKGDYEVMRAISKKGTRVFVYDRLDAKEHYTTHGVALTMVLRWLSEKKKANNHERKENAQNA